ncbi:MAG TPA: hypothetical protein VIK27_09670 [Candidatus Aquilonibacter sp.]
MNARLRTLSIAVALGVLASAIGIVTRLVNNDAIPFVHRVTGLQAHYAGLDLSSKLGMGTPAYDSADVVFDIDFIDPTVLGYTINTTSTGQLGIQPPDPALAPYVAADGADVEEHVPTFPGRNMLSFSDAYSEPIADLRAFASGALIYVGDTAAAQQKNILELAEKWKAQGEREFTVGMGINTGVVVMGNLGAGSRMNYTVRIGRSRISSSPTSWNR